MDGATVRAEGFSPVSEARLFLGNNGTGLRLLLAVLAALPGRFHVDGVPRLRERPIAPLVSALRRLGGRIEGDQLPLVVEGGHLRSGVVALEARESSQFLSALMFVGAYLAGGLRVELAGPVPSWPYVTMTAGVLSEFGVEVRFEKNAVEVRGPLRPRQVAVEGDWSAAAFPLVGVAVAGGDVRVSGLRYPSLQGDAAVADLLRVAGCDVEVGGDGVRVRGAARFPLEASLRDTPDLFPAASVLVAVRGGKLTGLGHLAFKESNRVAVMTDRLRQLGFAVTADGERFWAEGQRQPKVGAEPLFPEGDHRVAMALAVAALVTPGVRLADPSCVAKSWPDFWHAWGQLVR